jgi:septum formation inhibitor-activating ATPase MinD
MPSRRTTVNGAGALLRIRRCGDSIVVDILTGVAIARLPLIAIDCPVGYDSGVRLALDEVMDAIYVIAREQSVHGPGRTIHHCRHLQPRRARSQRQPNWI